MNKPLNWRFNVYKDEPHGRYFGFFYVYLIPSEAADFIMPIVDAGQKVLVYVHCNDLYRFALPACPLYKQRVGRAAFHAELVGTLSKLDHLFVSHETET